MIGRPLHRGPRLDRCIDAKSEIPVPRHCAVVQLKPAESRGLFLPDEKTIRMNKATLALVIGSGIAGVCAVAATVIFSNHEEAPASVTQPPAVTPAKNGSGLQGYANVWSSAPASLTATAQAVPPSTPTGIQRTYNMNEARNLRAKALTDPAALRALIQQYETEKDTEAQKKLKLVLATINKPEVIGLADQLISDNNPDKRLDGLELIQHLRASSPAIRSTVMQTLSMEQSPTVLVQAMLALQPAAVSSSEEQQIVSQLANLSENTNASVRRQSILSLGLWDNSGQAIDRLKQATADQAPEVRQAAQMALASINARLNRMKANQAGLARPAE